LPGVNTKNQKILKISAGAKLPKTRRETIAGRVSAKLHKNFRNIAENLLTNKNLFVQSHKSVGESKILKRYTLYGKS